MLNVREVMKNDNEVKDKIMLDSLARLVYNEIFKINLELMMLKDKGISIYYYNIDKDRFSIDVHSKPYVTDYISGTQISVPVSLKENHNWNITVYIHKNNFGWSYHQLVRLMTILKTFKSINLTQGKVDKLMNEAWEEDKKNIEYFNCERIEENADKS